MLGAKEIIKDYNIGLTNNISLEIPLFHNKIKNINSFDLRFIHKIKKQVRDYAKILNEKPCLNKNNFNYATIHNSIISIAKNLNANQNLSEGSTSTPKGIF